MTASGDAVECAVLSGLAVVSKAQEAVFFGVQVVFFGRKQKTFDSGSGGCIMAGSFGVTQLVIALECC